MAAVINRGGNCRICFYPQNGLLVSSLGEPSIAISQELVFLSPEVTIDAVNNRIYADLDEEDTMQLVPGVDTKAQAVFVNDTTQEVYRFPIHDLTVTETLFDHFYVYEEDADEEEEEE